MTHSMRPTWLEISRSALRNNVAQIRRLIGARTALMAVVKANAYGHGAASTAAILADAGVDRLAVASLSEALELRARDIALPILVLGYTPGRLAGEAASQRIALTVFDVDGAAGLADALRPDGLRLQVHLKVNTGMNRLGEATEQAADSLQALAALRGLQVEGIYSHFATSDLADKSHARAQFGRFSALLDQLTQAKIRPPIAHIANSAAIVSMPETQLDLVRSGILLYGMAPDAEETPLPVGFQPVLRWKAQIAQVRTLQAGDAVSYGREFIADRPMTVAVIPVGYADGFPRRPLNWQSVLVRGRPAMLLGRVCMDQSIIDVTEIVAATGAMRSGEETVLIGEQAGAVLSAEEVGRRTGTINYDVTSRILARVPRLIVE